MNKNLESDLLAQKEGAKTAERFFAGDLDTIRKELSRSHKTNQDLEVTNSELKEEVSLVTLVWQIGLEDVFLHQCWEFVFRVFFIFTGFSWASFVQKISSYCNKYNNL